MEDSTIAAMTVSPETHRALLRMAAQAREFELLAGGDVRVSREMELLALVVRVAPSL
jgi:hypothetical protein